MIEDPVPAVIRAVRSGGVEPRPDRATTEVAFLPIGLGRCLALVALLVAGLTGFPGFSSDPRPCRDPRAAPHSSF